MKYDGWKITIQLFTDNLAIEPEVFDMETSAARYIDQINAIFEQECPGLKFEWDVRHGEEGIAADPRVAAPADMREDLTQEILNVYQIAANEVADNADEWLVEKED